MPPRRGRAAPDDNLSFNSQLSGDLSVAGEGSSRRVSTAPGKGIIEFLVGNKRSSYSTPVYLFIVFLVSVVLWGVMPWIISAYAELNLEERIAALESRPAGSGSGGGLSASSLAELNKLKSEVESNLSAMKDVKSQVEAQIAAFNSAAASSGDITAVTANLAKLESELKALGQGASSTEASVSTLQSQVTAGEAVTKEQGDTLSALEQKIKDVHYSLDGVASTVASKCSGYGYGSTQVDAKSGKPNFALKCAGAYVEDIVYPNSGLSDMLKGSIYRYTGVNFDHDNPNYNVLDSSNEPGQCWCFPGQEANITIHLIAPMQPSEFFLHHIFMEYYNEAKIDMGTAAPKDFTVVGLDSQGEHFLGDYTYDSTGQKDKGLEQTFPVHASQGRVFEHIKVVFRRSAWAPDRKYTCVYQFGVHGTGVSSA